MAANLYYERGFTQEEVARQMQVSRPTVSKLLSQANREGIVRVSVRRPGQRDFGLQASLVDSLNLRTAVVFPGGSKTVRARGVVLAQGALELLKEAIPTLPNVRHIGLGWGRAVQAFVEALEQSDMFSSGPADVVPLIGGSGQGLEIFQSNELVRRVAKSLGARPLFLHAPALLANESVRTSLLDDPSVQPVVEAWEKLDIALVGVGKKIDPNYQHAYMAEYLQDQELITNAAGDICAHYYTPDGQILGAKYDRRVVAVGRRELRRTPLVVGMASGSEKIAPIVGAAQAGLINALVTDEETARGCLAIAQAA